MKRAWLGPIVAVLAVGAAPLEARATTVEIQFTASGFRGMTSYWFTHEPVPQDPVSGSFTVETDVVPDPGASEDHVTDVYTAPVAADLTIAGVPYGLADLTAYIGFVGSRLDMVQVGGVAPVAPPLGPSDSYSGVHQVSPTMDDFGLVLDWDELGNLAASGNLNEGELPWFAYTTAPTVSLFRPWVLTVTASVDGAIPQQVTMAEELPDLTVCEGTTPEGPPVRAGRWLCQPPPENPAARAPSDSGPRLRELKVPRVAGRRATAEVATDLGSFTLAVGPVTRRMLRANGSKSPVVEPPPDPMDGALDCMKARIAPRTLRFRPVKNVLAAGERYDVGAPTRLCKGSNGGGLLCHRARRAGGSARARDESLWVAHALGTEHLSVGKPRELCLPLR